MIDSEEHTNPSEQALIRIINKLLFVIVILIISLIAVPIIVLTDNTKKTKQEITTKEAANPPTTVYATTATRLFWQPKPIDAITDSTQRALVLYGKTLIEHTGDYLGPKGTVKQISNGMNCQNCHLQAGTVVFGNNYGSVASTYPKFRARSGSIENIYKRVNDCFERSLNGKALDTADREMQAISSYILYIGSQVPKGTKAEGSGLKELEYLNRAADPINGKTVFFMKCQSCHQENGNGLMNPEKTSFIYPPLWGVQSFNDGAGLYRISNMAKFVKYNMPQGVTYDKPQLTDEEAWDVAAFIVTEKRPQYNKVKDWPDKSQKPIDHPFGPYTDGFTKQQHKLGPFKPILEAQKKLGIVKK